MCAARPKHTQAHQINSSDQSNTIQNSRKNQEQERYTLDQIKKLFDYDNMLTDHPDLQPDIDSVMSVLHTAVNTAKTKIRIDGEDKPAMTVISKLMKLDRESILYAVEKFLQQTERIKNPAAYLLTILYNAPEQFHLDTKNQTAYDTAPKKTIEKNKAADKNPLQRYTDFPQRTYDYNALEKELLNKPIVHGSETEQYDRKLQKQLKNIGVSKNDQLQNSNHISV